VANARRAWLGLEHDPAARRAGGKGEPVSACLDCGGSECICGTKRRLVELESALLDCQRYVLENGIDVARAKIGARASEALRTSPSAPRAGGGA